MQCERAADNSRSNSQNGIERRYTSCIFIVTNTVAAYQQVKREEEESADKDKGTAYSACSSDYSGCYTNAPQSGLCDQQIDCANTEHCDDSSHHCVANQCSGTPPACDFTSAVCTTNGGTWNCGFDESPIIIDLGGNGYNLTSAVQGVKFDIRGDGIKRLVSWTKAGDDDAWLVLDRNGNGRIDSGREMFGNFTAQPSSSNPNGFLALAEFDKSSAGGNNDGMIDRRDSIFTVLRLWRDLNHNGISEPNELRTLDQSGVESISLSYSLSRWVDSYGNQFRFKSTAHFSTLPRVRFVYDVFLVTK